MKCFIAILIYLLLPVKVSVASEQYLLLPRWYSDEHPIYSYLQAQLALAMQATEAEYGKRQAIIVRVPAEEERQLRNLNSGVTDIVWATCTQTRNRHYRAVAVPQIQGLFGLRVNVIRKGDKRLSKVNTLHDLATLIGVQSSKWIDFDIMQDNGLTVLASDRTSAYRAVSAGIADYYPRGVAEVIGEMQQINAEELTIAPGMGLKYPMFFIIYVQQKNEALAQRLEKGFKITLGNGSFVALLNQQTWYSDAVSVMKNRKFIALENRYSADSCGAVASAQL